MKLAQLKSANLGQKVDHPLAKYNSRGDLYCLLCNNPIKNANVWKIHISSKTHKENLILFKAGKSRANDSGGVKRAASKMEAPPRSLKKVKASETNTSLKPAQSECSVTVNANPVKSGILKASSKVVPKLPEGFVPKSRLKHAHLGVIGQDNKSSKSNEQIIRETEKKSNLPSGFFDNNVTVSVGQLEEPDDQNKKLSEDSEYPRKPVSNIPDGFFDDAREDAKARKVEYKDPQQLEWEKFQDEMEQEDIRYNTILEEDDQKLREERDIDIGFEQKMWDYRVESMADSVKTGEICPADKEAFVKKLGKVEKMDPDGVKMETAEVKQELPEVDVKMEDENMSSDDEFDDVMDWRIKKGL